ncbi:hypothetical protein NG798_26240 [Ancylothrix sp. C2]|uniref:hypothetical protein n=1 Tax=Ancylothrix sp. D3o TaxID=2953691 RepID=UPI0021BB2718|nr:hypothetical protein [Ancylothrix sp. D3o]MCT7953303.1 hypothetical protein [Ancylothrix sp. D3o]
MTPAIDYIKPAKEITDAYGGVTRLDRLITLAETVSSFPKTSPSPFKADTDAILYEMKADGFQINPWLKSLSTRVELVPNAMPIIKKNQRWRTVVIRIRLLSEKLRLIFVNYFLYSDEISFRLCGVLIRPVGVLGISSKNLASISLLRLLKEQDVIG